MEEGGLLSGAEGGVYRDAVRAIYRIAVVERNDTAAAAAAAATAANNGKGDGEKAGNGGVVEALMEKMHVGGDWGGSRGSRCVPQ